MLPAGWQSDDPHTSSSSSKVEESSRRNGVDAVVTAGMDQLEIGAQSSSNNTRRVDEDGDGGVQITCLSEVVDDLTLYFQIFRLPKQVTQFTSSPSDIFTLFFFRIPTIA